MNKLRQELEDKLDKISKIYLQVNDIFHYAEYLNNPETEDESWVIKSSNLVKDLQFIHTLMNRVLLIEIAKLYGKSTNNKVTSIEIFVDSFCQGCCFDKIGIPQEKIDHWKSEIERNRIAIEKVEKMRNESLAHTAYPNKRYDDCVLVKGKTEEERMRKVREMHDNDTLHNGINYEESRGLVETVYNILNGISGEVFNTTIANTPDEPLSFVREDFIILKLLAKAEKQRQKEIEQEFA